MKESLFHSGVLLHGGRCRTQNAGFLRSFSVVLFFLLLLFAHLAYGDINAELVEAVYSGNTARVEQLLGQGADVNVEQKNGWTVLMDAAKAGQTETVKALIDAGANMTEYGDTALMFSLGNTDTAKVLIEAGADVNAKHQDGFTPLMLAAKEGLTEMTKVLIEAGADVNAEADNGWTALDMSELSGHAEIAEILKQAGARR